jgi:hypothetical protein
MWRRKFDKVLDNQADILAKSLSKTLTFRSVRETSRRKEVKFFVDFIVNSKKVCHNLTHAVLSTTFVKIVSKVDIVVSCDKTVAVSQQQRLQLIAKKDPQSWQASRV